jgi:hypothetical protein
LILGHRLGIILLVLHKQVAGRIHQHHLRQGRKVAIFRAKLLSAAKINDRDTRAKTEFLVKVAFFPI